MNASVPSLFGSTIGLDIGGTKIAAGWVEFPDGRLTHHEVIPTEADRGSIHVLKRVINLVHSLLDRRGNRSGETHRVGLGIGLCELVSPEGTILSANTFDWTGMDLAKEFPTNLLVKVEADVRAAALAEAKLGAGRDFQQFVYVTVGTGISCSWVCNGEPFVGTHGATGTFASQPMMAYLPSPSSKIPDPLTLEQFASGPALVRRFRASVRAPVPSNARHVLELAEQGDRVAYEIVVSSARALGAGIAQLINVLDPQAIILGGGLGATEGIYRQVLAETLRANVWWSKHREVIIRTAELGTNAGVVGAALRAALQNR